MHHLGNFSIRRGAPAGPTRAPPRGESVAPLSIIRGSRSRVARRPARASRVAPAAPLWPRGHLGTATSSWSRADGSQAISLIYYGEKVGSRT